MKTLDDYIEQLEETESYNDICAYEIAEYYQDETARQRKAERFAEKEFEFDLARKHGSI